MRYFRVRLYDPTGKYIAFAPYRLTIGNTTQPPLTADEKGIIVGQNVEVPNRCLVEWAFPPPPHEAGKPVEEYRFRAEVFLSFAAEDDNHRTLQMLNNLGYPVGQSTEQNVTDFQSDYQPECGLLVTGQLDPQTKTAVQQVHAKCADVLRPCPDTSGGQK